MAEFTQSDVLLKAGQQEGKLFKSWFSKNLRYSQLVSVKRTMSVVSQESYESAPSMLLTEPISPSSSATKSPSPGYNDYSREKYRDTVVEGEQVVDSIVYNSENMEYENMPIVSIFFLLKLIIFL